MRRSSPGHLSVFSLTPSDEKEVGAFIERVWSDRNRLKFDLEAQWFQNIAWYMGHQNMIWDSRTNSLTESQVPPWRVRLVINFLQSTIRTLASKLIRDRPEWDILPATTDVEDEQKAYLAKNLLNYDWQTQDMDSKLFHTIMWVLTTGNAFIKACWDPDLGEEIPFVNEDGLIDVERLRNGDVLIESVSPFEMICDTRADTFEKGNWCLQSQVMDVDEVKARFPRAKDLRPLSSGSVSQLTHFQQHLKNLSARNSRTYTSSQADTDQDNTIVVHELYIKPQNFGNKAMQEGRFVVFAGDKILNGKGRGVPFPYLHRQLPYTHFTDIFVPGRVWGSSTLEQLIAPQAEYNRTKSQIIEARNLMSKPKWIVPKGSGIGQTSLTSEPGEVIEHNPGLAPQPVSPPNLPSYVTQLLAQSRSEIDEISGVREVSKADAPGEVRSGRGILALIEQDEDKIAITIESINKALVRIGKQVLKIRAQYVRESRMVRVVGHDDELLFTQYTGLNLQGGGGMPGIDYFDVRLRTIEGLPHSRAAQQELLGLLIDRGVLNGKTDRSEILRMLNLGNVQHVGDKSRKHRTRQLVENQKLARGEWIEPQAWQDHQAHIDVLNSYRNSAEFDNLPENVQQLFEMHERRHKEHIAILAVEPEIMAQSAAQLLLMREKLTQGVPNEGQPGQRQPGGQPAPQLQQ